MGSGIRQKSWADREGIPTGVWGEIVKDITISEKNRATHWGRTPEDIKTLQKICREWYVTKGVNAVVFGVDTGSKTNYAVFVRDGFLKEIKEDD